MSDHQSTSQFANNKNDELFEELLDHIVYVGNLPKETALIDVVELFKFAGRIDQIAWYGEERTDVNSKVAFLRFRHVRQAREAAKWDRVKYREAILIVMQIFKDQWFDSSVSIMVRNIRDDTTDWQLYEAFRRFGKIYGIVVPTHGTALVGFYYEEETQNALEMDENMFNGNRLRVAMLRRNLPLQQIDIFDTKKEEVRGLRDKLLAVDSKLEHYYSLNDNVYYYLSHYYRCRKRKRRRVLPMLNDSSSSESSSSESSSSESSSSESSSSENSSSDESGESDDNVAENKRNTQRGVISDDRCLGIFGMSPDTNKQTLEKLFSRYGHLTNVKLIYDTMTTLSRGYAFIYFKQAIDAKRALKKLNGTMLDGRTVRVDFSRMKLPESRKRSPPSRTPPDRCCHHRKNSERHKKRSKRRHKKRRMRRHKCSSSDSD